MRRRSCCLASSAPHEHDTQRTAHAPNDSADSLRKSTVLWAQRSSSIEPAKNYVYVTISVPDVPAANLKLELKPTGLTFTGHSDTLKKTYHLDLELYAEIDDKASQVHHTGKNIELKLQKKELNAEFWPRLLKDTKKVHYLRTDFTKWVDEDEQDEAPEEDLSQFGGMGKSPLHANFDPSHHLLHSRNLVLTTFLPNRWHARYGWYVITPDPSTSPSRRPAAPKLYRTRTELLLAELPANKHSHRSRRCWRRLRRHRLLQTRRWCRPRWHARHGRPGR